jgi:hypothetical protein
MKSGLAGKVVRGFSFFLPAVLRELPVKSVAKLPFAAAAAALFIYYIVIRRFKFISNSTRGCAALYIHFLALVSLTKPQRRIILLAA